MNRKQTIVHALRAFAEQGPRLDFANYGDVTLYRAEQRSITKDLQQARILLSAIEWRDSITADDILEATKYAFSARLVIEERADGSVRIDYTTSQYWPTEYRRAVCAVASAVLWAYWRTCTVGLTADNIRTMARCELGRTIARRWFN